MASAKEVILGWAMLIVGAPIMYQLLGGAGLTVYLAFLLLAAIIEGFTWLLNGPL